MLLWSVGREEVQTNAREGGRGQCWPASLRETETLKKAGANAVNRARS